MVVHGGAGDALNLQCNADLHRPGAVGQVAVVVALAHAYPVAACVKGGAGHQHQIQLLRLQKGRAFQHRRADTVLSHRPAVRARHGCGKGKAFAAHRVGYRLTLPDSFGSHGGKVGFAPKGCVEQKGAGGAVGVQFQHPAAKGCIGGGALRRIQRLAGGTASGTLRLFFLGNGHTKHLASPVKGDT